MVGSVKQVVVIKTKGGGRALHRQTRRPPRMYCVSIMALQMLPVLLCVLLVNANEAVKKQNSSLVLVSSAPSVNRFYRSVPYTINGKTTPVVLRSNKAPATKGPVAAASKQIYFKVDASDPSKRIHRNAPKAYASGATNLKSAASKFFAVGPATSASHLVPVKEERFVIRNQKGYVKDSYGNSFVQTPQMVAYKSTLPQQYVKLQDLPVHLSQPLAAASTGPFYKNNPQYSYANGSPNLSTYQKIVQQPRAKYSPQSYPTKFTGNVKSFAPQHSYNQFYDIPVSSLISQQSSNQKTIYSQKFPHYKPDPREQKYYELLKNFDAKNVWQKLYEPNNESSQSSSSEEIIYSPPQKNKILNSQGNAKLRNEPQKSKIKPSSQYGKLKASPLALQSKRVPVKTSGPKIVLETRPPLPHLLDVSLLEPLTFDNPIVPQVQHFLPKIQYHVPKVDEEKRHHDEFVIKQTMSYDSGVIKQPHSSENNSVEEDSREAQRDDEARVERPPSRHVHAIPASSEQNSSENDEPQEFSVVNKSPNYKETYTQEVIKYDNSKEDEPKHYSYTASATSSPQVYSYSSTSKPYSHQTYISTNSESKPVKIVYSNAPQNEGPPNDSSQSHESSASNEDSREVVDRPSPTPHQVYSTVNPSVHQSEPYKKEEYNENPSKQHESEKYTSNFSEQNQKEPFNPKLFENYKIEANPKETLQNNQTNPKPNQLDTSTMFYLSTPKFNPSLMYKNPKYQQMLTATYNQMPKPALLPGYHGVLPNAPPARVPKISPRGSLGSSSAAPTAPVKYQTVRTPVDNFGIERYVNKPLEDIKQNVELLPSPNAKIMVPPGQHLPQTSAENDSHDHDSHEHDSHEESRTTSAPNIIEKSHKIIIQEETPDEVHSHREQTKAEIVDEGDDENHEEDFDKAFKESARGFPGYEYDPEQLEKEIFRSSEFDFNSDSEFNFNETPFERYVKQGDKFPKSARLTYRDNRDNKKENYYLDFADKTPGINDDRKKHRDDYYKIFEKNTRPEAFFDPPSTSETKESRKSQNIVKAPFNTYNYQSNWTPTKPFAQYRKIPQSANAFVTPGSRDSTAHAPWPYHRTKRSNAVTDQYSHARQTFKTSPFKTS